MKSRHWLGLSTAKFVAFSALSWLVSLWPLRRPRAGVLILRLDAAGDFFLWLQSGFAEVTAHATTLSRPVVLLAGHEWADYARGLGAVDEVCALDTDRFRRDPGYRIRWLFKLRRRGFEYVIQPRLARQLWIDDWIVLALNARESIGSPALDSVNLPEPYGRLTARWYTRLLPGMPAIGHESIHNSMFAKALCGTTPTRRALTVTTSSARNRVPGDYFVVAPGASHPGRRWPADRFAAVVGEILRSTALTCVLTGSRREESLCKAVARAMPGRCINLAGQTTLGEMVALIGSAQFVLGNESAPCHIAAALEVPSISILGGGHFGRFLPYPENTTPSPPRAVFEPMECYHCSWNCIHDVAPDAAFPCIERIHERAVLAAVAGLTQRPSRSATKQGVVFGMLP